MSVPARPTVPPEDVAALRGAPRRGASRRGRARIVRPVLGSVWAVLQNIRQAIVGVEGRRPSVRIGLKLLWNGQWNTFHRQLIQNAMGAPTPAAEYAAWRARHALTPEVLDGMRTAMASWADPPKISVIVPVFNVGQRFLRRCIQSVLHQVYSNWELCIADDASTQPHVRATLEEFSQRDPRIKIVYREQNGGIAAASNSAMQLATGNYLALLDHDDELAAHALFRAAEAIVADPAIDMLYSDEDKISPDGKLADPFFKPDWSPDYFLACMYTCHLGVYRTAWVRELGGFRSDFDGAQDYDLVLRLIERNAKIFHVPDVLYHWRTLPGSTASGALAKPFAHRRAQSALEAHLLRIGRPGKVEDGPASGFHRVRYSLRATPKVSLIIPSACRSVEFRGKKTWLVLECVRSVREMSTYPNLEIIVLDDNSMSEDLRAQLAPLDVKHVPFAEPFNFSRKINLGARAATGEQFVLLNDDIEVISPDWIESMLEYSQWPEVGAVGAQLLFPNDTQQHTGVTLLEGNPSHPFYGWPAAHPGYFFSSQVHRNWSAVTAACMMTRAEVFREAGGFSEEFPLNYNDVDYCLRVRSKGRRIVYMPFARLYHHESFTKPGTFAHELEAFKAAWLPRYPRDPYYNPNLTMRTGDFRIN